MPHFDGEGRVHMVDVAHKEATRRRARAEARLRMNQETLQRLMAGELAKGDGLAAARVAGIMAAKETWRLIPLCHPIALTSITVNFTAEGGDLDAPAAEGRDLHEPGAEGRDLHEPAAEGGDPRPPASLVIEAVCETVDRTGVEMEALTAASVAALAVYDMCKGIDRAMFVEYVGLEEKTGGVSGPFRRGRR